MLLVEPAGLVRPGRGRAGRRRGLRLYRVVIAVAVGIPIGVALSWIRHG